MHHRWCCVSQIAPHQVVPNVSGLVSLRQISGLGGGRHGSALFCAVPAQPRLDLVLRYESVFLLFMEMFRKHTKILT